MAAEIYESSEKTFDSKMLDSLSQSKRLKKSLLTFSKIFEKKSHSQEPLLTNKILFALTELLIFLQFTSLMWRPTMSFNSWSSFSWLFEFLSYSRLDTICSSLGLSIFSFLFFSAYIYSLTLLFFYTLYCSFNKSKPISLFSWVLKKESVLGSSILFIPATVTFLGYFLDAFGLYQGKPKGTLPYYYYFQELNCVFCLALHVIYSLLGKILNCEVNHGAFNRTLASKASCEIDIKGCLIDLIVVVCYCLLPDSRVQIIYVVSIGVKAWIGLYLVVYLPYYNSITNKIVLSRFFSETFLAGLFGATYFIDQSEFLFFATILLIPIAIFMAFQVVEYRYGLVKITDETINVNLFELALREELMKLENPSKKVVEKFNNFLEKTNFILGNVEMVAVWECYYCINTLKDYRLAYIKLVAAARKTVSLEIYVQVLKIKNFLKENFLEKLEDLCFLDYILKLNRTKQVDREICEIYLDFSAQITGKSPSKSKLKQLGHILCHKLDKVAAAYKKLTENYPNGIEVRRLLNSFSEDIYFKDKSLLSIKLLKESKSDLNEINYFDDANGILIVSGEAKDLGKITYVNERFAMMLRTSPALLTGLELNSIIPYPYNKNHNETLTRYAKFCTTSLLRFPGSLFLKTENNFLVEFHFKISCVSLTDSVFYLVVAKEIENDRICVLVSPTGMIYGHSENFKQVFKSQFGYFENQKIQDVIPEIELDDLPLGRPKGFESGGEVWHVIKTNRTIAFVEILVLFIVKSGKALEEIIKQNFKEIEKKNENQRDVERLEVKVEHKVKMQVKFNASEDKEGNFKAETNLEDTKDQKSEICEEEKVENEKKKHTKDLTGLERILKESLRRLQIIKLLFVLFILCIAVTVSANIVYFNQKVQFSQSNQLKNNFLQYIDLLEKTTKSIVYMKYNISADTNFQTLSLLAANNTNLNTDLYNSVGEYSTCTKFPLSFQNPTIYFFIDYQAMYMNKMNLFNAIKEYQYYTNLFLLKNENMSIVSQEEKILFENGQSVLYSQALNDLNSIDECFTEIMNGYVKIQTMILFAQLAILLSFLLALGFQIFLFIKGTNLVWNRISSNAYNSFFNVKRKCCDRMTNFLQAREEEVQVHYEINRVHKNEFNISFSQINGYVWRFSIMFVLTGLYLVLFHTVFLENVHQKSLGKNDLINSIYMQKYYLERIETYSLLKISNVGYAATLSKSSLAGYKAEALKLVGSDFGGLVTGLLYEYLYDYNQASDFLKYGLHSVGNMMMIESCGLIFGVGNQTWVDYYIKGVEVYGLFDLVIGEVSVIGNSQIEGVYSVCVVGMILYVVVCFLLCFGFYFPYLRKKSETMVSFQNIFKLFILSDDFKDVKE